MYLMTTAARVNNRKWNLGRMGLAPVRLPNLGGGDVPSFTSQGWRRLSGMRGLRGLGAPNNSGPCVYYAADGTTVESMDPESDFTSCGATGGEWLGPAPLNTPALPPGAQNPSPVTGGATNGGITTVLATKPSQSPLDYTSPQAAIAAGLDPTKVYAAWTASLARFPSPQAAIAAGVPAGVVNQLWQQAHVNAANAAATTPPATLFGIPTNMLLLGGAALLILPMLGGGRRR